MKKMDSEDEKLYNLLKEAVKECYEKDIDLISRSMEQDCVDRIFFYMQKMIYKDSKYKKYRNYNLDCE